MAPPTRARCRPAGLRHHAQRWDFVEHRAAAKRPGDFLKSMELKIWVSRFSLGGMGVDIVTTRPPFASARVRAERIVLGIVIVMVVAVFAVAVVLLDPSLAGIAGR